MLFCYFEALRVQRWCLLYRTLFVGADSISAHCYLGKYFHLRMSAESDTFLTRVRKVPKRITQKGDF